jgi:hypothetical protein
MRSVVFVKWIPTDSTLVNCRKYKAKRLALLIV